MLHRVNKTDIAGTIGAIKQYHRPSHGVMRMPLTCVPRKTIINETYGDYPKYAIPDNKIIASILHLPLDKNRLHNEQIVKENTAEYEIKNRSVYGIFD